jgi:hypothetical protein
LDPRMTRIDTNQDEGNGIQIPTASLAIIRVNSCDSWTEPLAARGAASGIHE